MAVKQFDITCSFVVTEMLFYTGMRKNTAYLPFELNFLYPLHYYLNQSSRLFSFAGFVLVYYKMLFCKNRNRKCAVK